MVNENAEKDHGIDQGRSQKSLSLGSSGSKTLNLAEYKRDSLLLPWGYSRIRKIHRGLPTPTTVRSFAPSIDEGPSASQVPEIKLTHNFHLGDITWVKLIGSSWWPAQVCHMC
jgi:hypothetical protein